MLALCMWAIGAAAQIPAAPPAGKPPTEATKRTNAAVLERLNFADKQDFEDATRGLIVRPEKLTIMSAQGHVVRDLEP